MVIGSPLTGGLERMIPTRFLLVASLALAAVSNVELLAAQQPKPTPTADERAVLDLEEGWAKAVVKRDAAMFKRLLAPGFVYTEDDRVQNGEQLTRDVVSGTDTVTEARNEDLKTHTYGNTMIVTGWLIMKGRSGGKPFERRYRFTDTWLKRDGQWQIIAAQDYLLPARR
jgi:ketosteroid isomerase-like protein